ncbi:SDR family NAD(P)-dependent oxidoreductase [Shewanella saliphila]|uniref:Short-chain dehydrogenase n=1 Tax=Shewanella saliphila TaxID=2282698 RepID=A0ABQ2QAS7_9GAMM|nr:SDR family NAD(P)-dependent oxidoreductase [Shewanella saliphila]MCL1103063.1 SDR family NAD(P)-dependent oxidoreductase [Shewanella saliphila]GGP65298.1 short-chain dehydrogenase [Shewanella saliphila]
MSDSTTTETIIVIGASSFIAQAFIEQTCHQHAKQQQQNSPVAEPLQIITISRQANIKLPELMGSELTGSANHQHFSCDYQQASIEQCVCDIAKIAGTVTRIVMCNGILHSKNQHISTKEPGLMPEKRIEDIDAHSLEQLFYANSIVPMLWLSALTPLLSQPRHKVSAKQKCVISILSARVGSISDNRLGGWYGYRASKAALNMLIKTTAVEYARRLKRVKLIAFHPGTTDTPLSKPFQANVPQGKLFTPAFVASQLQQIMDNSEPNGEASYLDWQGEPINW